MTNGYAALYAIMYWTTSWIFNGSLNWVDIPFTDYIDPSHYATIIIIPQNCFQIRRYRIQYNKQIKKNVISDNTRWKYSKIATKLLAKIDILITIYPGCELPTYLHVLNLALSLVVHPFCNTITINTVAHPKGNKTSAGSSILYQHRNSMKQCTYKDEVALNALLYNEMNEPKHVCIVQYEHNILETELKDACKKAYWRIEQQQYFRSGIQLNCKPTPSQGLAIVFFVLKITIKDFFSFNSNSLLLWTI